MTGEPPIFQVKVEDMEKRFGDRAAFALQILSSLYARTERAAKGLLASEHILPLQVPTIYLCPTYMLPFQLLTQIEKP